MNHSPQVALPQGMTRRDVIAVISEIGRDLNLSSAAVYILTKLIGSTNAKDWTEPGAEPIFYGTQETMAQRCQAEEPTQCAPAPDEREHRPLGS